MNVFRRFAVEPAKMANFYGEVLGLKQLPSLTMPGGGQMMLFEIGSGQVKLQFTAAAGEYKTGPVRDVTGLRVFTFFYTPLGNFSAGLRTIWLSDPDGVTELLRAGRSPDPVDGEPVERSTNSQLPNPTRSAFRSWELEVGVWELGVAIASRGRATSCFRLRSCRRSDSPGRGP
jgi:hypothetical protein